MTKKSNYSWKIEGDILAYYLNQFGFSGLVFTTYKSLATQLGTTEKSLKARVQNVRYVLNPAVGLSHPAKQTINVVNLLNEQQQNAKDPHLFQKQLEQFLNHTLQ